MSSLKVGTKFHVHNGHWYGLIVEKDGKKYIEAYDTRGILRNTTLAEDTNMGLVIKVLL